MWRCLDRILLKWIMHGFFEMVNMKHHRKHIMITGPLSPESPSLFAVLNAVVTFLMDIFMEIIHLSIPVAPNWNWNWNYEWLDKIWWCISVWCAIDGIQPMRKPNHWRHNKDGSLETLMNDWFKNKTPKCPQCHIPINENMFNNHVIYYNQIFSDRDGYFYSNLHDCGAELRLIQSEKDIGI